MAHAIDVYIISGFLGSGKTTLLLNWLEDAKREGLTPGVVVNEWGDVHVESDMYTGTKTVELLNGCICCTIQDDLKTELANFLSTTETVPDVLFIEGTGVADPLEVVDAVTDPAFYDKLQLQLVATVIDSARYLEFQSRLHSAKDVRQMLTQQIEAAPLLLLNKVDLISEKQKAKVHKKLSAVKQSEAVVLETEQASFSFQEARAVTGNAAPAKRHAKACSHDHDHDHDHHHHAHFDMHSFVPETTFSSQELQKSLTHLSGTLLRAKGVVETDEGKLVQFQWSGGDVMFRETTQTMPRIVLIGFGLDEAQIQSELSGASTSVNASGE
ncbi:G3E family GTPase [Salsuginibacillus halophilus]|uniref:G3E family GTPase n=1 Tax=Salsuginibacillus halophilus TaxID=517424 RepID=A0A2P8HAS7_9BACI|nr:GTP-binding protein [Salsuginibacillus halophilus]PSL43281.1 G3E family GTPase [Salsuginibacillus halophilus]